MRQKHLCTSQALQFLLFLAVAVLHILVLPVYLPHHYQRIKQPLHSFEEGLEPSVMLSLLPSHHLVWIHEAIWVVLPIQRLHRALLRIW